MPNHNPAVFVLKVRQTVMFPPLTECFDDRSAAVIPMASRNNHLLHQIVAPKGAFSVGTATASRKRHYVMLWHENVLD